MNKTADSSAKARNMFFLHTRTSQPKLDNTSKSNYGYLLIKEEIFIPLVLVLAAVSFSKMVVAVEQTGSCATLMDHKLQKLHSKSTLDLCEITKGKAVLVVNTASHCGYTKQFSGLEKLHKEYQDKGLVVVGFPSNSFNQEADDEAETANVCYKNFGVTFTMTEKVPVKGKNAHPVFASLAKSTSEPSWNFNKYLISKDGKVVEKFASSVKPTDKQLTALIEKHL